MRNEKSAPSGMPACPIAVRDAPTAPLDTARAILGGAPSALDRIRTSQQAAPTEVAPPTLARAPIPASLTPANLDEFPTRAIEPASRSPIAFAPQNAVNCQQQDRATNRATGGDESAIGAEDDPTIELGTRAIPVKRTRFDDRWDHVRRAAPAALMHAQLRRAKAAPGLNERDLLARVNQWVNRQIAYVGDDRNYRQRDFWATAEQTIARGRGDCEDFAILKMQLLRAAGVDAGRMKLVLLRDLAANSDHAFLLVQTAAGKVVLDNMTDRLYDGSQPNSVRPVLSFSENRRWVHAYRGAQPSPNVAALPASQKPFALALNNQRSVKAEPLTFKTGFSK